MAQILVVDDRPINREFLATLLGYAGHRVIEAADGAEALEVVRAQHPELVITDILMPTMDGVEFTNRLHADPAIAHIPVIFYTATYRLSEAHTLARSCGVSTVIAKPSEPQVILDAVNAALGIAAGPNASIARAPLPETALVPPGVLAEKLSAYLSHIAELQLRMHKALEEGMELVGEQGDLHRVSDELIHSLTTVQALGLRLAALTELGLELSPQRDPPRLVELFCRAARDIMGAKYTGVGLLGDDGRRLQHGALRGLTDPEAQAVSGSLDPRAGLFGEALGDGKLQRARDIVSPATIGLPASHPPITAFLVVPVTSALHTYGWLYFADKLGADGFGDDDEQFAMTLAAQLAFTYENLVLYGEVQRYAGQLEAEIVERQRAAEKLRESELHFRQLAENIHEVFFLTNPENTQILYISPAYEDIWGRSCESLYARPQSWADDIHPDDRERTSKGMESMASTGRFDIEYRIVRPDATIRWIKDRAFPIRNDAGEIYRVAGIAEDITEQKEQQEKIARLSRIYAVLSGINAAIVRIRDRNELFQEACRIAVAEGAFRMAWIGVIDPDTLDGKVAASFGAKAGYGEEIGLTARADTAYSDRPASRAVRELRPVICNDIRAEPALAPFKTELLEQGYHSIAAFPVIVEGRAVAALALFAGEASFFDEQEIKLLNELAGDISFSLQYIETEEKLDYLAYYDALTGLANSTLFHDRLTQFLHGTKQEVVSVILIDLDRFTQLNDTLGRHVGDALLRTVAARLDDALREPCSVARISADTFAVAVADLQRGTDAATILYEQIFEPLSQPCFAAGNEVRISARAGIALYPGDGHDAATLFKNAEAALKQAQSSGERYVYYAPEINAQAAQKLALESKLRKAAECEQFVLHYQPKVDAKSGRLVGLEALIRWNDPDTGLVPPVRFIGALEETGLIVEVGRWVLHTALSDRRHWLEANLQPPRIAVNVSPLQLQRHDFADMIRTAIEDSGAEPEGLELEITESLIMKDIEANTKILRQIRDMGISIAIDDFGTGYSSLRYLAKLPIDSLKIDRSFVVAMVNDPDNMAIVSTVISLAHALNLGIVAEGVDSEEQAKFLRLMKCDEMQGYLFSKPIPADACAALLQKNGRLDLP